MDALNKWIIYKQLYKNHHTDIFLPETMYLDKPEIAFDMLCHYKSIFIKPCLGHGGLYILQIERVKKDVFKYYYYGVEKQYSGSVSYIEIETMMLKQMRVRNCICQRSIRLAKYESCIIDFRIQMRKDSHGWHCFKIFGRMAAKHSIVTNIEYGGAYVAFDKVKLPCCISMLDLKEEIYYLCKWIAKDVSIYLSKTYPYHHCIDLLTIDIAVDHCGRIWIIDVNPFIKIPDVFSSCRELYKDRIDKGIFLLSEVKKLL